MLETMELTGRAQFVALRRLREVYPDMTILQAMAFFYVAGNEGVPQKQVREHLEAGADSTASRILGMLADVGFRGTAGVGLLVFKNNPHDRRERLMYLSPKGKRLMASIMSDLSIKAEHGGSLVTA
jgi:DNA-binding MarR family transcriptional regulator